MELNSEQIETKTQNDTQIEMSTEMEKENPWKVVTTLKRRRRLFQDANEVQQINKVQPNSDSSQQTNKVQPNSDSSQQTNKVQPNSDFSQQINKIQHNSDSSQQMNENFVDSIPDLLLKTPEKDSPLNSERNNEVDKKVNKKRALEKVENHHNENEPKPKKKKKKKSKKRKEVAPFQGDLNNVFEFPALTSESSLSPFKTPSPLKSSMKTPSPMNSSLMKSPPTVISSPSQNASQSTGVPLSPMYSMSSSEFSQSSPDSLKTPSSLTPSSSKSSRGWELSPSSKASLTDSPGMNSSSSSMQSPTSMDIGSQMTSPKKKKKKKPEKRTLEGFLLHPKKEKSSGNQTPSSASSSSSKKRKTSNLQPNPNPADSNTMIPRFGKTREKGKPKRFTKMKKLILLDRQRRLKEHNFPLETPQQMEEDVTQIKPSNETSPKKVLEGYSKEYFESISQLPKPPNSSFIRDYCTQIITPELNDVIKELLGLLLKFHSRLKATSPQKAKVKRRLVSGFREVARGLERNKIKCVILTPNVDEVFIQGGLNQCIEDILAVCKKRGVEVVFGLRRNTLGRALGKHHKISIVGIKDYDGANDQFNKMIQLAKEGRRQYLIKIKDEKATEEKLKKKREVLQHILQDANILSESNRQFIENFIMKEDASEIATEPPAKDSIKYIPLSHSKAILENAIQEVQIFLEVDMEQKTWYKLERKCLWPRTNLSQPEVEKLLSTHLPEQKEEEEEEEEEKEGKEEGFFSSEESSGELVEFEKK